MSAHGFGAPLRCLGALAAIAVLLAVVAVLPAAGAAGPAKTAARACRPPRGPGDNQVHSTDVRATRVSCNEARRVMLRCNNRALRCRVNGHRWHCRRGRRFGPLGYRVACASGRRSVRWAWID